MSHYSNLVEANQRMRSVGLIGTSQVFIATGHFCWWHEKNVADLRILGAKRTSNRFRLVENRKCSKCTPIQNRRCIDKIYDQHHQMTVKFYKNIFLRSSWEFLLSCSPIAIEQLMRKFFDAVRVWKKWRTFRKHARLRCIEPERNVVLNAFNCINQNSTYIQCKPQACVLPTLFVKLFDFRIQFSTRSSAHHALYAIESFVFDFVRNNSSLSAKPMFAQICDIYLHAIL